VDGSEILQQAADLARRGEAFALATVVWRQGPASSHQGARAIISADGKLDGWIGGACAEPVVIREARDVIATGSARLLLLGSPEQFGYPAQAAGTDVSGRGQSDADVPGPARLPDGMTFVPIACSSEGALEVYIEPVLPVPHLVVIGSSPMASTLAELARALGWRADLIAGRDFTAADASERSMVVVATQGQDDEGLLERAAAARPAYLGLIGSERRGAAVLGYLADRGVDPERLAGVRVPAGLDLGPTTHREIAVAVLAELVQLRAAGALGAGAPASAGTATPHAASQTDPVCGMAVDVGPASRTAEYQGRTYYFCCAGCQQAFETQPAAYVKRETRC
jgi:xanthine dehydrogenase accessory factor